MIGSGLAVVNDLEESIKWQMREVDQLGDEMGGGFIVGGQELADASSGNTQFFGEARAGHIGYGQPGGEHITANNDSRQSHVFSSIKLRFRDSKHQGEWHNSAADKTCQALSWIIFGRHRERSHTGEHRPEKNFTRPESIARLPRQK